MNTVHYKKFSKKKIQKKNEIFVIYIYIYIYIKCKIDCLALSANARTMCITDLCV